jgi:hypothetical protein
LFSPVKSILDLVAQNEMDQAIKRIRDFGGISELEKQRQFMLYMLCLMELTLLDSRQQPWAKTAIVALLENIEQDLKATENLINWDEFFQVINGNGPCNKLRLKQRNDAHTNGQWVRDAAKAYAEKQKNN